MVCVSSTYLLRRFNHFIRKSSQHSKICPSAIHSTDFHTDTNKAKKKWRNLRDKFVKKRRRHGGSSANEDEGQREFYNSLMFLDGHVNSRK